MGIIELRQDDPIIRRAVGLTTTALTEVGFIPNDEFGCKIYASNKNGRLVIMGIHSKSYGCKEAPLTVGVEIVPSLIKKNLVN